MQGLDRVLAAAQLGFPGLAGDHGLLQVVEAVGRFLFSLLGRGGLVPDDLGRMPQLGGERRVGGRQCGLGLDGLRVTRTDTGQHRAEVRVLFHAAVEQGADLRRSLEVVRRGHAAAPHDVLHPGQAGLRLVAGQRGGVPLRGKVAQPLLVQGFGGAKLKQSGLRAIGFDGRLGLAQLRRHLPDLPVQPLDGLGAQVGVRFPPPGDVLLGQGVGHLSRALGVGRGELDGDQVGAVVRFRGHPSHDLVLRGQGAQLGWVSGGLGCAGPAQVEGQRAAQALPCLQRGGLQGAQRPPRRGSALVRVRFAGQVQPLGHAAGDQARPDDPELALHDGRSVQHHGRPALVDLPTLTLVQVELHDGFRQVLLLGDGEHRGGGNQRQRRKQADQAGPPPGGEDDVAGRRSMIRPDGHVRQTDRRQKIDMNAIHQVTRFQICPASRPGMAAGDISLCPGMAECMRTQP